MRKYGCLGLKWLRDKLSHVFSEEKNKNNKQNIKNSQRCSATTNISQESPSFFFSFFLVFQFFLWLCGSFYKFASKKIEKMKKKKSRFSPRYSTCLLLRCLHPCMHVRFRGFVVIVIPIVIPYYSK
jgi:hypothetical protein